MNRVREQLSLLPKKDPTQLRFPGAKPKRMGRITWRELPFRDDQGVYRGRIAWVSNRLLQAIITHTPRGYDLGWYRYIDPREVICVK